MIDRRRDGAGAGGAPPRDVGTPPAGRFREFGLTSFAVDHATSVVILFIIVCVAGLLSYLNLPKEAQPDIEIPMVVVNTIYPGVSPADVETLITRPLEEELSTISEVEEMISTSVEGYSSITVEFSVNADLNEALQQVRERVDIATPELPAEVEDPNVIEINLSEFPIMQVNLAGEYGLVRMKEVAEELQERFEQIPGILRADVRGGLEREVRVDVDLARLKYYGLSINDVAQAIGSENVNIPGGSIEVGDVDYLVRVDGEFVDPAVIEDLVVEVFDGRAIYVRDVADVEFGFADRTSYARLNGNPVVTIDVVKRSGANLIEAADEVKRILAEVEPQFPPTTEVVITGDQSREIFMMVSSLENSIISGLILILSVLFFFLGGRTAAFVALAIPTSMMLSFVILAVLGITMNMIVLFSLILALGMLVDNAIVVVENIYRFVGEGWSPREAAKKATGEVARPIIAATATTLAAFAPLTFWPGMVGEFMGYLPLTLIITLSSSLFVALVIVPTFCAMFLRPADAPVRSLTPLARRALLVASAVVLLGVAALNPVTAVLGAAMIAGVWALHRLVLGWIARAFQATSVVWMLERYEGALLWALRRRALLLGGCAAALVGTFVVFGIFNHGVEFFPEDIPPAQLYVDVEAAVGTNVEFTEAVARSLEDEVRLLSGFGDVESVVTTAGGGSGNPGASMMGSGGPSGQNQARVSLSLIDFEDRAHDGFNTLRDLQQDVGREVPGAEISAATLSAGPPAGSPVNIEVVGTDPDELKRLSDRILAILENAPVAASLVGLESDLDEARPELAVRVNRELAALYGLSTGEVGSALRGAVQGFEAARYRDGNDEYDIIVRLAETDRADLSSLEDLVILTEGTPIPLLSVAEWQVGEGLGSIRRKDMDRLATISAGTRAGLNQNLVLAEVQETLAPFAAGELPPGYELRYTGQAEEQLEAQAFLGRAFAIALMLIAFILISQFNSVVKPFIILSSVIMSTVGVLLGLLVFNLPFVIIMTGIGVISLAGIVVNNAIVLIDYIDVLRDRDGIARRDALVLGGLTRFRPVILTAVTTALGLVPLAIGLNFNFFGLFSSLSPELYWGGEQAAWWRNMALSVIAGILFATFLTLIVVPVLYSIADDATVFLRTRLIGERSAEDVEATAGAAEPAPGAPVPEEIPAPPVRPAAAGAPWFGREAGPGDLATRPAE